MGGRGSQRFGQVAELRRNDIDLKTGVVRIAIPQDFPSSGAPGTDLTPQGVH